MVLTSSLLSFLGLQSPGDSRQVTTSLSALDSDEWDSVGPLTDKSSPPVMKRSLSPKASPPLLPAASIVPRSFARTTIAMKQSMRKRAASSIAESENEERERGGREIRKRERNGIPIDTNLLVCFQIDADFTMYVCIKMMSE